MAPLDPLRALSAEPCRPVPRYVLEGSGWAEAARQARLHALWADTQQVHALLEDSAGPVIVSTQGGVYPDLMPFHHGAALFQRMIKDLWGHTAAGGDGRPWLDHGQWPHTQPMAPRPGPPAPAPEPPAFAFAGRLMQVPLGPVGG